MYMRMQVGAGFRNFFKGGRVKVLRIKGERGGQAQLDANMGGGGGRIHT